MLRRPSAAYARATDETQSPSLSTDTKLVDVIFHKGDNDITTNVPAGTNLLTVAEECGAIDVDSEFCLQGSCYKCEVEVQGGALEEGGAPEAQDVVRACLCTVKEPSNGEEEMHVTTFDDDDGDIWV